MRGLLADALVFYSDKLSTTSCRCSI